VTHAGLAYDPTMPDPVVLDIDGPEFYADGWAAFLDPIPAPGHQPACWYGTHGFPAEVCPTCQPPL
jgi:hypothetical protein